MNRRTSAMVVAAFAAWAGGCRGILGIGVPDVIEATDGGDVEGGAQDSGVADEPGADTSVVQDGGADGPGAEGGGCIVGTQRCSGAGIETCTAAGQWSIPWACATGACSGNACVGATKPAKSCASGGPGVTDCGPNPESCCTSPEVPGGTYDRTYVPGADGGPTGQADPATLSGFRLDKYLVTVGRFRQFVIAWNGGAGYVPPPGSGVHSHLNGSKGLALSGTPGSYEPGWTDGSNISPTDANLAMCGSNSTWTKLAGTQENLPINCVTWQESYAFCIWDGGFLPSEAEWEYAAAAGALERHYPWGTTDPGTGDQYALFAGSGVPDGGAVVVPVGTATLGAGLWGQLDLAGELWEWNLDWFSLYASPCVDCAFLTASTYRVQRGGSFHDNASSLVPSHRSSVVATVRYMDVGIRCARTP